MAGPRIRRRASAAIALPIAIGKAPRWAFAARRTLRRVLRLDVVDDHFARRDLARAEGRTPLELAGVLAEKPELVVERTHFLTRSFLGMRFTVETGPRSMMPRSANRRRTVSEGCA